MNLKISKEQVLDLLKNVKDPELLVNIVDLGLVYKVAVNEKDGLIEVEMTFTTPFCPYGASIQAQVNEILKDVEGVKQVNVRVVFDPAWDRDMMNDEAKIQLGLL